MMTAKEIKCNFTKVFALFNSVEEITDLANNICAQVKDAFETRKNEIQADEWIGVEDVIEIVEDIKERTESKEEPKIDKATSKTARAKEMAAKFKKDKSEAKTEPKKEVKAKKETAKTETKKEVKSASTSDDLIAITDTAAIKKLGLTFEKYNDRCYVLRGNTKPLRKVLKEEFRGVYNGRLTGGEGWVIAAKHAQNCAKALGLKLAV